MGMALLLVTHDFGVVADVCDSAVVMYAGQVVERAPVGALFDLPLNPYTATLLHSDPHRAAVGERLPALHGHAPAPGEWLPGCRLADRCPLRAQECSEKSIPLIEVAPDRVSRCIRVLELAAQEADRG